MAVCPGSVSATNVATSVASRRIERVGTGYYLLVEATAPGAPRFLALRAGRRAFTVFYQDFLLRSARTGPEMSLSGALIAPREAVKHVGPEGVAFVDIRVVEIVGLVTGHTEPFHDPA